MRPDRGCPSPQPAPQGPVAPPNPDWDALLPRHAARERSAVIQLASPSSNASRCLFLASLRQRTLA